MKSKPTEQNNAVIYARFSSHAQNEQSIDGQLRVCTDYAKRQGYTIIQHYCDAALSGKVDRRPEFQRMIEDSKKKQFQYIIVYKVDRFARNRYDSAVYKYKLKQNGVKVLSAMEQIGDDPTSILLEAVLEASAEYYSVNLAENVRRGKIDSASKGLFVGGVSPIGYRIENQHLVPDERTAPIVRKVFEMYADGLSMKEIDAYLKPFDIRTARGTPYTCKSFHIAFASTTYIGRLRQGEVECECPAIISEELWNRVQSRIAKNRARPQKERAHIEYLLTHKLFCGHCGATMAGSCGKGKGGELHYYYMCKGHKEHTCTKRSEQKEALERWVVEQTVRHVLDPKRIKEIAQQIVDRYQQEFGQDTVKELEKRVDNLRRKSDRLLDELLECPESMRDAIRAKCAATEAERQEAEIDLAKQRIACKVTFTVPEVEDWIKSFADGDADDIAFQRRIIDTFVNSVYVYDDKIVIWYNIKGESQPIGLQKSEEMVKEALPECLDMSECSPPISTVSKPHYIYAESLLGIVVWR